MPLWGRVKINTLDRDPARKEFVPGWFNPAKKQKVASALEKVQRYFGNEVSEEREWFGMAKESRIFQRWDILGDGTESLEKFG